MTLYGQGANGKKVLYIVVTIFIRVAQACFFKTTNFIQLEKNIQFFLVFAGCIEN